MKLFQHKALGGNIIVTSCPRYESTPGYTGPGRGYTIATFDNGGMGQKAHGWFAQGLAQHQGETAPSLYDEDTSTYVVGDAGQLAA